MTIVHQTVDANGIRLHLAEAGPVSGPLVLLCHGFPESWYSWRHQIEALAAAGYRAVAPDMRGYGNTDAPEAIDQYSMFHLVGDMVGVLDALKTDQAVIVGHDWGAPVAWNSALYRPDRFRAVAGLSVPFNPRGAARPTSNMPATDEAVFYQTYFQTPGIAEAEFERDVRATIRGFQFLWSGDARAPSAGQHTMVPRNAGFLTGAPAVEELPAWVSEQDLDFYAGEFQRSGFRGPLNWYRNMDRNWEQGAPWAGAKISVPALYIFGEHDMVRTFRGVDRLIPNLEMFVPHLREKLVVPSAGHWLQRERPNEVNAALLRFLASLA